jgi:hypothetical protein
MIIGYLTSLSPRDRFWYERFSALARDMGAEVRVVRQSSDGVEATRSAWTQLKGVLTQADAFFLPDDTLLMVDECAHLLHERVRSGARLLVRLNENCLRLQNTFLAKYDLTGTSVRIRSPITPLVRLKRSPDHFRDVRLFVGVDEVQIQHPNAIWYGGESLPVLVADDRYLAIDGETDLPGDWNARELACAAAWHGGHRAGVLAISGGYFEDPFDGATGIHWPGINLNQQLARNVLEYLAEGRPCDTPEDRCKRIEINLVDFVFGVLKGRGSDWWTTLVPEKVRQKCEERRGQERGRFPVEAYCDLIDLKTVMEKNWQLYRPLFQLVQGGGGKDASLHWLTQLNELRRLVGHPLKKHVTGYVFTEEDQALLREGDALIKRLVKAVAH